MEPILQTSLPFAPWMEPSAARLPGIRPVDPRDWLVADEAFAGQMASRDRLIAERPEVVLALDPAARPAAEELVEAVAAAVCAKPGYRCSGTAITRPDGVTVAPGGGHPMAVAGRLAQEDFCILERRGDEHVLTAAVLCFPASWTLAEKAGRPLLGIHEPVESYDADIGKRVQRLFDAIRPGQVLMRANALLYADAELHQPRRAGDRRPRPAAGAQAYMRSERQCLVRLPRTGAVVFSIHTLVLRYEDLTSDQRAGWEALAPGH